jgi:cytochrome P450
MIYLLSRNPDALRRAREEVVGKDLSQYENLNKLPYVEACINETMRLKPVAPINVAQAARDTVVGDVAIPLGTLVMCLMRPPAVDARQFPDPAAFRPERWLTEGNVQSIVSTAKRVAMPFGAGPRVCPGRYLALAEIKMVMAMLLARFEILDVTSPRGDDVEERLTLTMSPVGLRMKLGL